MCACGDSFLASRMWGTRDEAVIPEARSLSWVKPAKSLREAKEIELLQLTPKSAYADKHRKPVLNFRDPY